jgi:hypothetical protein
MHSNSNNYSSNSIFSSSSNMFRHQRSRSKFNFRLQINIECTEGNPEGKKATTASALMVKDSTVAVIVQALPSCLQN